MSRNIRQFAAFRGLRRNLSRAARLAALFFCREELMEIRQHNDNELPAAGCPILSPWWPEDRTYRLEPLDLTDDEEWRQTTRWRDVEFVFVLVLGIAAWAAVLAWLVGWI
jgi:hypothetical protein